MRLTSSFICSRALPSLGIGGAPCMQKCMYREPRASPIKKKEKKHISSGTLHRTSARNSSPYWTWNSSPYFWQEFSLCYFCLIPNSFMNIIFLSNDFKHKLICVVTMSQTYGLLVCWTVFCLDSCLCLILKSVLPWIIWPSWLTEH